MKPDKTLARNPLGDRGERLVGVELKRRKFRVRHLGARAPDWDLVAEKGGKKFNIQVKTIGKGSWQCGSATKFIKINLVDEIQQVTGKQVLRDPNGIYIFINLEKKRTYYLMGVGEVQHLVFLGYKANLRRHKNRRPKNPYTFHHAISMKQLRKWKENWAIFG